MGGPASLLQAVYNEENRIQRPVDLEKASGDIVKITENNWTHHLGKPEAYHGYLEFFSAQIALNGVTETAEKFIFHSDANRNGSLMVVRFTEGALHSFIQFGYGAEFDEQLLIASGLAQAAVHGTNGIQVFFPTWPYDAPSEGPKQRSGFGRQPSQGLSLLAVLREVYDSPILTPPMPYNGDLLIGDRRKVTMKDGRPEEIVRIASLWSIPEDGTEEEWESRVEECTWLATLIMAAVSKPDKPPRIDFFLMHALTTTIFLPSILGILPNPKHKRIVLLSYVRVVLQYLVLLGRPRINPELLMSYTEVPRPPVTTSVKLDGHDDAVGIDSNPWTAIIASASRAKDAHVPKCIRELLFAAKKYGTMSAGDAIGAFKDEDGKEESHLGCGKMDGSIFIRAAGVVMDVLGWVDHGQREGQKWFGLGCGMGRVP